MNVDVISRRNVKLHCRFVVLEKQAFDEFHFWPVRAPIRSADRNVVPAFSDTGDDLEICLIDG